MLLRKTGNWGWSTLWNDLPSGPCQCTVDQFVFLCLRLLPTESPVSLLHPSLFGLNENGRKRSQSIERPWLGSMSRDEGLPQMPVAFSKPDRIMD